MATNRIFTISASTTIAATGISNSFSLSAFDASNMAMTLTNNGPSTVAVDFAFAIDVNRSTYQALAPGQSVLLTNAGSMTSIAAQTVGGGASLVVSRGSVAVQNSF